MKIRLVLSVSIILIVSVLPVSPLHARWAGNGLLVKEADTWHNEQTSLSDGEGGVIVAWRENVGENTNIFAQRIDEYGNFLWEESGVVVCDITSLQSGPKLVSDGQGGAIIIWYDNRNGFWNLYAQCIDDTGKILWVNSGVAVTTSALDRSGAKVVTDKSGGAIVTWFDYRNIETDIFAQRIDAGGNIVWTPGGLTVCDAVDNQFYPDIIEDGYGGAIITWYDSRNGNGDIYGTRINSSGGTMWIGFNGTAICTETGNQSGAHLAPDGSGGAIVMWIDYRGVDADIYGQRVNSGGVRQWLTSGAVICAATDDQWLSQIISDGAGGATSLWKDSRNGNDDIYSQRIDGDGAPVWATDGIAVCTAVGTQEHAMMALSGNGKIFYCWQDARNGSHYDMYAQVVDTSGTVGWAADGIVVCDEINNQGEPYIISGDPTHSYISWEDERTRPFDSSVYIQMIDTNGYHGIGEPIIKHIADLPEDQGGWIRIEIRASDYDMVEETVYPVIGYNVWRRIGSPSEVALYGNIEPCDLDVDRSGLYRLLEAAKVPGARIVPDQAVILGLPPAEWESLGFHAATQNAGYNIDVPTRSDSVSGDLNWETYILTAHTTTPSVYFTSLPDSAYSVDNIPPAQPTGFMGEPIYGPPGLVLSWDPNVEPDLWGYYLYRGSSEDFTPGPANYLGSTVEATFTDEYSQWSSSYYKVAAVDYQGNKSPFALLAPENVTDGDHKGIPATAYLTQNYPNPFNPTTTIRFDLPSAVHVKLSVYSVKGELVSTLIDRQMTEGRKEVTWTARDNRGRTVSSGIYLYCLVAGDFVQTKKMVLLR